MVTTNVLNTLEPYETNLLHSSLHTHLKGDRVLHAN